MEKSTINNTLTDDEIVEFLLTSGYEEKTIRKAMQQTSSRDVDSLVEIINNIELEPAKVKLEQIKNNALDQDEKYHDEALRIYEENKKKILADRAYREELIKRLNEDKLNKIREEKEREEKEASLEAEKVVKIKADCTINVRFPDARSKLFYFNKDDTIETLYERIEDFYGTSNFTIYKPKHSSPILRSDQRLEENKLLYPKSVLFIE